MNVVELIGNLGKDPIMRATRTGRSVASFSVATSREIVNPQTGEKREITDWIQCVAWGVWAEAAGAHLKKGTRVHVIGRIQTRSYDAQDGTKRYVTEVVVENISIPLNISSGGQGFGQFGTPHPEPQARQPGGNPPFPAGKDEDIPF